jgi:deazaflavin-dependent oxidoreductase (nitroreductase family)
VIRTPLGYKFVEFMRGPKGKRLDIFLVKHFAFSLLMAVFAARAGFAPLPVLMIYTTGRKSGEERATVMPYIEFEGRLYLIGANGAKPKDPFWVENLRAKADAKIVRDRKPAKVRAREVLSDTDEYQRLWQHAKTLTQQYSIYQDNTTRKIPVMVLEPVPAS